MSGFLVAHCARDSGGNGDLLTNLHIHKSFIKHHNPLVTY